MGGTLFRLFLCANWTLRRLWCMGMVFPVKLLNRIRGLTSKRPQTPLLEKLGYILYREPEMNKPTNDVQTFLGPQTKVEGKLAVHGMVRIDGQFEGEIASRGCMMTVGETAFINADISVRTVTVMGEIRGNVHATERIHLCPTARVFGDLRAPELLIEVGVILDGHCTIKPEGVEISKVKKAES
jgi:cytoskeletal protein CcmA (bactofilin family)